jgi:hypothetical protein
MIVGTPRIVTWKMGMIIMHDLMGRNGIRNRNPESFIGVSGLGPLGSRDPLITPISHNQNFKKAAFENLKFEILRNIRQ